MDGRTNQAVQAAYRTLLVRVPELTLQQFEDSIKGWEIIPLDVKDEIVGCVFRKGSELHVAVLPEAKKKWFRKFARKVISETLDKYGEVTTSVPVSNKEGHAFVTRIGFQLASTDGMLNKYVLKEYK